MIDMPFEEAVAKIKDASGLSDEEIQKRIDEKLEQLSGLISKDGAAHIVANELGVKLAEPPKDGQELKISDLQLQTRGAVVLGKVVRKWEVKEFDKNGRQGKVANLLFGDDTGVIRLTFWNDQVDVFEALNEGDVLRVRNPFVKKGWQDRLEMQLNDQSSLDVNPEGVTVEVKEQAPREEREQKYIKDLKGDEKNVEVVATIVQVYDPRFFLSDPETGKKIDVAPEGVTPLQNFVMSAFLDDGTGNIRTTFWRKQTCVLTGKSEEEFLKYKDDPTAFEEVKTALLGEIVKIVGSVRKNEDYDRMDLNAQLVFKDVDPAKEMQNLEKKLEQDRQEEMKKPESPAEVAESSEQSPTTEVENSETSPSEDSSEPEVKEDVISLDQLEEMGK